MNTSRIYPLNSKEIGDGPIVYWMDRDMRIHDNWALIHAQKIALERKVPLIVTYNLVVNFLQGSYRQWDFKIKGLQEVQESCEEKNIPFFLIIDINGRQTPELMTDFCSSHKVGALITDCSPLKIQRAWKEKIAKNVSCAMIMVDAHNIVPIWIASDKQEYGAYTLRPKIHKLLPEYLDEFPVVKKHPVTYSEKVPSINWKKILGTSEVDKKNTSVTWIIPGEQHAKKALHDFIKNKLHEYGTFRNDPLADAQSNLSPYLHYGMIAPQHVAMEVIKHVKFPIQKILDSVKNKASVDTDRPLSLVDHAGAFLEELIVRRELADNFCWYNNHYDTVEGFPDWAKKSHHRFRNDKREYVYTLKQFEHAKTHDELWNAAQLEMVNTGKMHGYMRMYWAKKILEWTANAEDAMKIAIYLNDRYELDGRDPNGYAGIAWSIGGVHDRAWFEHPIFGQIRYMARSGCEKKFDVKAYIKKHTQQTLF